MPGFKADLLVELRACWVMCRAHAPLPQEGSQGWKCNGQLPAVWGVEACAEVWSAVGRLPGRGQFSILEARGRYVYLWGACVW